MASVLVAYATKYGSTLEVARVIAAELEEHGVRTEVWPAAEVRTLEGFSAVVLGGAIYFSRLHRDARRFLGRHREALEHLPIAVFATGPLNDTAEEFHGAREQLVCALGKEPWCVPVAVKVFGGRLDPTTLRFPHNNPVMKSMPPIDIRDWEAVREWADGLPEVLHLEVRQPLR